eukprot:3033077-Prymnesium_polylepis.1
MPLPASRCRVVYEPSAPAGSQTHTVTPKTCVSAYSSTTPPHSDGRDMRRTYAARLSPVSNSTHCSMVSPAQSASPCFATQPSSCSRSTCTSATALEAQTLSLCSSANAAENMQLPSGAMGLMTPVHVLESAPPAGAAPTEAPTEAPPSALGPGLPPRLCEGDDAAVDGCDDEYRCTAGGAKLLRAENRCTRLVAHCASVTASSTRRWIDPSAAASARLSGGDNIVVGVQPKKCPKRQTSILRVLVHSGPFLPSPSA